MYHHFGPNYICKTLEEVILSMQTILPLFSGVDLKCCFTCRAPLGSHIEVYFAATVVLHFNKALLMHHCRGSIRAGHSDRFGWHFFVIRSLPEHVLRFSADIPLSRRIIGPNRVWGCCLTFGFLFCFSDLLSQIVPEVGCFRQIFYFRSFPFRVNFLNYVF